jgi:hypothetical protein
VIRFWQGFTVAMMIATLLAEVQNAHAYTPADSLQAIDDTAAAYGWWLRPTLRSIARCESGGTFDPNVVGDHGTSYGLVQLHRGGLLERFYAAGYDSAFDPWQSLAFLARVLIGDFPGITVGHWTCG